MKEFEKILSKLSKEKPTKSKFYISIYCPLIQGDRKDFVKRLNSLLHSRVNKTNSILENKSVFDSIQTQLISEIYRTQNLKKGVAIFISLNKKTKIAKLVLIPLHKRPIQEAFVGNGYDLDQLVWITSMKNDALILNIQESMTSVYEYEHGELDLIFEMENSFYSRESSLSITKSLKKNNDQVVQSTKRKKLKEQKKEGINAYIQAIIEQIEKAQKQERLGFYDFIISFYPGKYSQVLDRFKNRLNRYAIIPMINKLKEVENDKVIRDSTGLILEKIRKKIKSEVWNRARMKDEKFVLGWYDTAHAARKGEIKTLFIKSTARKKGFLFDFKEAYTYAVKNSKKVNNIGPWIVKGVVENKGRVYQFKKFPKEGEEIAAELL